MEYVALVTLLLIIEYMAFTGMAGGARAKGDVKAPAMIGDQTFERAVRVQLNTLEQLVITLPAMWICASYFRADVAALLGATFFVGRLFYRNAYMKDPSTRLVGMLIGFLANIVLVLSSAYGVISNLLA
jgi:glutathione S-transferase